MAATLKIKQNDVSKWAGRLQKITGQAGEVDQNEGSINERENEVNTLRVIFIGQTI